MAKTIKDTDYLVISARIRAMETQLLTRDRMEQILQARTDDEVDKVLQDCGYPHLDTQHPEAMDAALSAAREQMLSDLRDSVPDTGYLDVFQLKYDYHNAKAILKAAAVGADPASMLVELGRVPAAELQEAVREGELGMLPETFAAAVAEAKETLDTTRDPQLCDVVLDRYYYQDLLQTAEATGSEFLTQYVRTQIDGANLRALVRTVRMGKPAEFLQGVLTAGGEVSEDAVLTVAAEKGRGLADLYGATVFRDAAAAGEQAVSGGTLTEFETLCDDAVMQQLEGAQLVPFGEAPLVAYLAARETEYTNLRILLLGRMAGLQPEIIRSRLRRSCQ